MIWDVAHTLHFLSQYYELLPGDLDLHRHAGGRRARSSPATASTAASTASARSPLPSRRRADERHVRTPTRRSSSSAATTTARRFPITRGGSRATPRPRPRRRAALAPQLDLRYGPGAEGDARPVRPGRRAARDVRVHPRRLLARARQERLLVRRGAVRRAGHRRRRGQLRSLSGRVDRDDRRRVPARGRVACRAKGRGTARDVDRIVVGGHSAGGHLAAMLLATDWRRSGPCAAIRSRAAFRCPASTISRRWSCSRYNADLRLDAARRAPLARST